jgi:hypothetical protein
MIFEGWGPGEIRECRVCVCVCVCVLCVDLTKQMSHGFCQLCSHELSSWPHASKAVELTSTLRLLSPTSLDIWRGPISLSLDIFCHSLKRSRTLGILMVFALNLQPIEVSRLSLLWRGETNLTYPRNRSKNPPQSPSLFGIYNFQFRPTHG